VPRRASAPGHPLRDAVGEDDGVLDAIARYCIDQIGRDA
jgi:sirohydrochlorin cobaltochelatase